MSNSGNTSSSGRRGSRPQVTQSSTSQQPKEPILDKNGSSRHMKRESVHAHFLPHDVAGHAGGGPGERHILEPAVDRQPAAAVEQQQQQQQQMAAPALHEPPQTDPRLPQDDGKRHILLGATGSVSTGKLRHIIHKLEQIYGKDKVSIQLILTRAAEGFVAKSEIPSNIIIWTDEDEWKTWRNRADPVVHIELRRWADILVVAPLTANTLGKIALGLCDNLLTNVIRAWNTQYPILIAPAMLSYAYNHPATKRHLRVIKEDMKWIEILKPVEKVVGTFGDIGMGGMMDWNEIVNRVVLKLGGYPQDEDEDEDDDDDDDGNSRVLNDDDDEDEDEEEDDEVDARQIEQLSLRDKLGERTRHGST
ncbi:hypothetical protein TRICI_002596 [Trichomonascus ciferrii]|uniref:Flavoprotein domain-containing protein n=1 Tax=Trichomonascus ciferrii TaxID=44093 RepID=A0A642V6A6_9ASCO|nr:hypothetical protein TRICI_002596 [Trichomonascus ciferrii]